ncbi:hypothetical protein [Paraherbaspirillum soli]|uniref:N-acetyltransferase domain-containing protein n=1 Tax=Paraherbaspirillum soli TaxID=631222 RepID=A0ABW0MAX1_9BURK
MQTESNAARNIAAANMTDNEARADLRIRPGTVEDANDLAELFCITYGQTTHPCQSPDFIRNGIASNNELWFVAEADSSIEGSIGGCLCVARHSWNRTWETCYAIIHPRLRSSLSGLIYRLVRTGHENLRPEPWELGFYTPRTPAAHRVMSKTNAPVLVGHDGGPNLVDGLREYHMMAIHRPTVAGFSHVSPLNGPVGRSPFIQQHLYAPLALQPTPGAYPSVCFTGSPGAEKDSLFRYSHDQAASAITLSEYVGSGTTEWEICADLEAFAARDRTIAYMGAYILADKVELIRKMLETGFVITAYLPAWHLHRNSRYDCVMLVKRSFSKIPEKRGFDADIEALDRAYVQLAAEFCQPNNPSSARDLARRTPFAFQDAESII